MDLRPVIMASRKHFLYRNGNSIYLNSTQNDLHILIMVEGRTESSELPCKVKEKLAKNKPERVYRWICTMSATLIKY